jgi:hypothetical protein
MTRIRPRSFAARRTQPIPPTSTVSECRHSSFSNGIVAVTRAYPRRRSSAYLALSCVYPRHPQRSRAVVGPPLGVADCQIRRYLCGRPDPFRSVRDLGRAAVGCPCKSGVLEGHSSAWLPAWLPAAHDIGHRDALVLVTDIGPSTAAAPELRRRPVHPLPPGAACGPPQGWPGLAGRTREATVRGGEPCRPGRRAT